MKLKKIPLRMCTGCMEMKLKKELIRVVRTKDGEISMDLTGKKSGRGAYICRDISCLEKSFNTKRLSKSLEVDINQDVFNHLKEEINE